VEPDTDSGGQNLVAEKYGVARDKYEAKLFGPALADLASIQEDHPKTPEALAAYFLTAEIHEVAGNIEEAMATYVEIQSRYPNDVRLADISYRLGRLTLRTDATDRFSRAIEIFERVVNQYPESSWAPKALRAKAEIERARNLRFDDPKLGSKVPAEVFTYQQLLNTYPDAEGAEEALWRLSEAYEDIKHYERSAQAAAELVRRFPQTQYDAWWKAAQLYDRKLDDKATAIKFYSQVPDTSKNHRDAQKRLQKLRG
jgi:TolA-binding protein